MFIESDGDQREAKQTELNHIDTSKINMAET
jgi:hypothetical protein